MARVSVNKSVLHKRRNQLNMYRKVLPSLDLKRQQLTAELNRVKRRLLRQQEILAQASAEAAARNPMLANRGVDLQNLICVKRVQISEKNLLGAQLPELQDVEFEVREYGLLTKPHWVDTAVLQLQGLIRRQLELQVLEETKVRLERALKKSIQRVNLLEKRLIPQAQADIRKISIVLADTERAAVVRSKIAKARHSLQSGRRGGAKEGDL